MENSFEKPSALSDNGALMYDLRNRENLEDIKGISRAITAHIEKIVDSDNKKALRLLGIKLSERSLKKVLARNFPVFRELDNLKLIKVGINIVRSANNVDSEDVSYALIPLITYPPNTSSVPTPETKEVSTVVRRWIEENRFFLIMPFFVINTQTYTL